MRKKMIIKIISWIIFIGLVIALIVGAINIYMVTTTSKRIISVDDAKDINADCIIVLGAGVKPSGKPSWMLEDRIIVGEQLYNVNAAPKLLMSGDHGRENYDEVNTMKNYAINDGIPSEDIFMDHAGFETYDSMYRAKKIFGAKKVVIVSQKYHLYRSLYIAKKMGLDAYGVSSDLRYYSKKQYYSSKDARWVKFEAGYHEFVVDLQKKTRVQKAMLRMLNYNPEKIGMPVKTYLYTSIDGKEYNLSSIKDAPYFPNNKHDAWIESILFDQLDENVRYVKVAFEAPQQVYIDELFINPVLK